MINDVFVPISSSENDILQEILYIKLYHALFFSFPFTFSVFFPFYSLEYYSLDQSSVKAQSYFLSSPLNAGSFPCGSF